MHKTKKELWAEIDRLRNRYDSLKREHQTLLDDYCQLIKLPEHVKSKACFSCQKMIDGKDGDVESIVCQNDIECKQYKRKS